ncbi:protein OS-9 homolog [Magnolia sinica]|uniref:protein OS-9 homolog n=1 Tax=Magnolia sinica TaxID=86752 RepID=UPI002657D490|nr:protein OS-9 homolog [Magnolia sinica]
MRFFCLLLLLFFILFFSHGLAEQIYPAHAGGTFGRSSREPKYKIEFHPADSPFHPDDDQESLVMTNMKGQNFLCFLPMVEETKSGKPFPQQNMSNMIMESDRRVKLKTPDELMEVLTDRCLLRQEGWWSYEFCYKQHLKQLHVEDEKIVQEFVLGVYDPEATAAFSENRSDVSTLKDPRSKDAAQRYHAHVHTNGTICDLTNQPRETEVRFVCSEPRFLISSIKEISTCKYAITIHCPLLCKHPMFQEERPIWQSINCNELPSDGKGEEMEGSFEDQRITMITDAGVPNRYDMAEGYAT